MDKSKKNPLIAGLINMLLPGSVHLYFRKDWRTFGITFIGATLVLIVAIGLGLVTQNSRFFSLPQGICPGTLALAVLAFMFKNGLDVANEHNQTKDDEKLFQSRKPVSQENEDEQLKKIQRLRDEGLISEQQYNTRRSQVSSNKEQPTPQEKKS